MILGWIPRNFKTLILKPELPFLRDNHKIDNRSEFAEFYEFALFMNFAIFLEKALPVNKLPGKNPEIHPSNNFYDFPRKMTIEASK